MLLNNIFSGIFDTSTQTVVSPLKFILCIGTSLLIGLLLATVHTYKSRYTKSFVITLALLPSVVCVVIMMVNGNVGAGVAVAGAFGLVRFRSVPGTAKEIGSIFLAMGTGLAAGMGYLAYALLFAIIVSLANIIYNYTGLGGREKSAGERILRVTIPEDLDYSDMLDDLLREFTKDWELLSVRTTNMGSLFKLTYQLTLKNSGDEKKFIDEIRCRNGNLEISSSRQETIAGEL